MIEYGEMAAMRAIAELQTRRRDELLATIDELSQVALPEHQTRGEDVRRLIVNYTRLGDSMRRYLNDERMREEVLLSGMDDLRVSSPSAIRESRCAMTTYTLNVKPGETLVVDVDKVPPVTPTLPSEPNPDDTIILETKGHPTVTFAAPSAERASMRHELLLACDHFDRLYTAKHESLEKAFEELASFCQFAHLLSASLREYLTTEPPWHAQPTPVQLAPIDLDACARAASTTWFNMPKVSWTDHDFQDRWRDTAKAVLLTAGISLLPPAPTWTPIGDGSLECSNCGSTQMMHDKATGRCLRPEHTTADGMHVQPVPDGSAVRR